MNRINRIDEKLSELKKAKRAALMPYLPLGFPTIEVSQKLIRAIADAGADMIELGVPFSDPVADGPVIQNASNVALKNGMSLAKALEMVEAARKDGVSIPLTMMGYYNPFLQYGLEKFAKKAKEVGVDGLIIPDLPPEEAGALGAACREHGLNIIFLAAPTSTQERLKTIAEAASGFIYLVSVVGVTGARDQISSDLGELVARVKAISDKPACVGFGISSVATAKQVAAIADGVIVGSALVSRIGDPSRAVKAGSEFVAELRMGLG